MKKKAICIIMVLMMISVPSYRAYADAGIIAITGGSIAIGGAGTIASGAIAGPVVVAVFCGMMAMGMNVSLTNASQEAGMTKTQYLKSKLEQYCNEAQITYGVFNNAILDGTTVLQNGAIKLGSQAGTQIKQFVNWLFNKSMVQDMTNAGAGSDQVQINGNNYPLVSANTVIQCGTANFKFNESVAIVYLSGYNQGFYFFNRTGVSGRWGFNGTYEWSISQEWINGYAYNNFATSPVNCNIANVPTVNLSVSQFLNGLDGTFENAPSIPQEDTFTGSRDEWASGNNALDPTQGKSTVINPGLIGTIPIPADTDITVNIRDYLDALEKVLDGIQAGIVARDKETDIPITIPIPDETVIDPTIDKEDDQDLPDQDDQTPVTDPDKPVDPEKNPSTSVDPLKFDLKNIFPFCIPFDIKDMLSKLNAEPVAPNYHVDWNIPLLETSLEFDINLACWNSVAAILRKMELLSFIVGLAVLTRNLIRG